MAGVWDKTIRIETEDLQYIRKLLDQGFSYGQVALRLNREGKLTPRGKSWTANNVFSKARYWEIKPKPKLPYEWGYIRGKENLPFDLRGKPRLFCIAATHGYRNGLKTRDKAV